VREISAVVDQLRAVRQAKRQFMGLWTLEQAIILPALDRVAADVNAVAQPAGDFDGYSSFNEYAGDDDE
jgi:hypothetical protein